MAARFFKGRGKARKPGMLVGMVVLLLAASILFQVLVDGTPAGSAERAGNFPSAVSLTRFMGGIRQYFAYTFFIKTDKLHHVYGNDPELIPYYLLTIYLDPHYVDAYYVVCGLIYDAGRRQEALDLNLRGIEANPDSADLYLSLADLYLREKRLEEAREAFEKAVGLQAKLVSRYTFIKDLAVMYGALGKEEKARRSYLEAAIYNLLRLKIGREIENMNVLVGLINEDYGQVMPRGYPMP